MQVLTPKLTAANCLELRNIKACFVSHKGVKVQGHARVYAEALRLANSEGIDAAKEYAMRWFNGGGDRYRDEMRERLFGGKAFAWNV